MLVTWTRKCGERNMRFYRTQAYAWMRQHIPAGERRLFAKNVGLAITTAANGSLRSEAEVRHLWNAVGGAPSGEGLMALRWSDTPQGREYWLHWYWWFKMKMYGTDVQASRVCWVRYHTVCKSVGIDYRFDSSGRTAPSAYFHVLNPSEPLFVPRIPKEAR